MPNGNSFSWLSFLLGLAIGLWIAIVVLFLTDQNDHSHCCVGGGPIHVPPYPGYDDAWVPGGDDEYYCTNNDEGGAIVMDEGGAIVMDEGGAIVMDEGGHVPAPDSSGDQLGRDRQFEEFRCTSNDEGGAIVMDRADRRVVVAMPNDYPSARCGRRNGHATVVNELDVPIRIDSAGDAVPDAAGAVSLDETADSADDGTLPAGAPKRRKRWCAENYFQKSPLTKPVLCRSRVTM